MFDHRPEPLGEPADEPARLDALIEDLDWSVPAEGAIASRFAAPSGALATVSLGDPSHPRVVLVPGVSGSKEDFLLVMPLLAAAGFYAQSFDLAGQFESAAAGPPSGERFSYRLFSDDLVAFLEAGRPAHLLGYSFGGTVSQLVTVERPELVLSLTLLATPPRPGNGFAGVKGLGPFTWMTTERIGAALMTWGITSNQNHVPPQRLAFVRQRFEFTSRRSMENIIGLMKRAPDLRPQLNASPAPKLVVVGSHDLWPVSQHAELAERIGAAFSVYPTGHSPCETAPNQLVRDMLVLFDRARVVPSESAEVSQPAAPDDRSADAHRPSAATAPDEPTAPDPASDSAA